ncbi:unnamed protein product, partial [marine sediment metagenome]
MVSPKSSEIFRTYKFPIILIVAIIIGSIVGLIMGEKAVVFKPFGDIFINLMFTIVVPLVFFTISSAVSKMVDLKRLGRIMGNILLVFMITGLIASVIMIFVVTAFPPEAFPIIATIGILVDAPATLINATGDTVVAMIITRMIEGKEKVTEIFKEYTLDNKLTMLLHKNLK